MISYLGLLEHVRTYGERREDRTGVGTLSVFGARQNYDLSLGFPLVTTRKIKFDSVVDELLWFISGSTNVNDLPERTQHWWRPWAYPNGDLGPIYGKQFRDFGGIDQLQEVRDNIIVNPTSRRHIITLWNPPEIQQMALPPCHGIATQFYVRRGVYLDCQVYIRSNDLFLGCPVNTASYALLTHLLAVTTSLKPGRLYYLIGDAHIYINHLEQVDRQLKRNPIRPLPKIHIESKGNIGDFKFEDITLTGYDPHPHIPARIAV